MGGAPAGAGVKIGMKEEAGPERDAVDGAGLGTFEASK